MSVHQLKVTLADITPPIWRRLQVRSDTTLATLHELLQIAMGWEDYHLHAFGNGFGNAYGEDINESTVALNEFAGVGDHLSYTYDFGDTWEHDILVEKILTRPRPGTVYPRCTGGRRACPPEDCGGPPGYVAMLRALRARKGARYREIKEWLAGPYDPEAFDLAEVNEQLAKLKL